MQKDVTSEPGLRAQWWELELHLAARRMAFVKLRVFTAAHGEDLRGFLHTAPLLAEYLDVEWDALILWCSTTAVS